MPTLYPAGENSMTFNTDFVWGEAVSGYQTEGAAYADGKGLSIWDVFCTQKGRILEENTGDVSCDMYHKWKEDIQLMKQFGIRNFRFSLSWPRIFPEGIGTPNKKGVAFYDEFIDTLLENGIDPWVTLYHWDLPYELYKKGGFLNQEFPEWFASYTRFTAQRFGDRVQHFFTFNEPQCIVGLGYQTGKHAPGQSASIKDLLAMQHTILLAHGRAVQELRAFSEKPVKVGMVLTGPADYPASDTQKDRAACEKAQLDFLDGPEHDFHFNAFNIATWADPVYLGQYPDKLLDLFGKYMPVIGTDDMKIISEPVDFQGQNIYNGSCIAAGAQDGYSIVKRQNGFAHTDNGWPMTPESMYYLPMLLSKRYKVPVYITENGLANEDWIALDGKVHDPQRIDFLTRYLRCLRKAVEDGADIRGYFHWSLLDNFEWAKGYGDRFGMVYVDYATQKRIPKDSLYWYRAVISSNGGIL